MCTKRSFKIALLGISLFTLLALAALVGCGGPEPVHSVSPVQTPTLQLTKPVTPTSTSQPTEPATPTPTQRPTATPSPVPTPQPYPTPDWAPYEDEPFTIVFQRHGELWLSEVGGRGEWALTNEGLFTGHGPCGVYSFAVSPDGRSILYIVHDEHNDFVKVADILNGSARVVGSTSEPYRVLSFGFQPLAWWDGTHIAYYISKPPQTKEDDTTQLKNLVVVDLGTGESTVEPVSTLQHPSPDGRYVLSGHKFRGLDPDYLPYQLYDRETGEQWTVTRKDRQARFLGWSPDSRLMLFNLTYELEDSGVKDLEVLLIVDAETHTRRVVTPEDRVAHDAVWSPDGQTIAYLQCDPPTTGCGNPELWLTSPDGASRRRIPMEESIHCTQISWTPDGSRLVFETTREPRIWSIRLDGTDLRPIAHGQDPQVLPAPQRSPAGSQAQVICRIRQR